MKEVTLTDTDRTIFAVCPNCNKTGVGMKAANYFSMAYTRKQWKRQQPVCDNCQTEMKKVYEVELDD